MKKSTKNQLLDLEYNTYYLLRGLREGIRTSSNNGFFDLLATIWGEFAKINRVAQFRSERIRGIAHNICMESKTNKKFEDKVYETLCKHFPKTIFQPRKKSNDTLMRIAELIIGMIKQETNLK